MTERSIADAKAHFSACLREAERGEPVTILRHGRPVAVLVSAEIWRRRQQAEIKAEGSPNPLSALARRVGEGGDAVHEATMDIYRNRSKSRDLPAIDTGGVDG